MWTKTFFCSMFQNKRVFPEYLNLSPRGELAVCNRMNLESTPPQSCDLIVQNHNCLLHILILKLQRSRGRRWVQDFFKGLMLVYPSMFGGIHVKQQIKKKTVFKAVLLKIHVWLQRGNYEQKVIYPLTCFVCTFWNCIGFSLWNQHFSGLEEGWWWARVWISLGEELWFRTRWNTSTINKTRPSIK